MVIQCNVKRGAGERVAIVSLDRFVYRFEPRPELTGNDSDMVAEVNSRSHQEYLLSHPEDFSVWEGGKENEKESSGGGVSSVPAGGNDGIRGDDGGATAKRRRKQYPSSAPGVERDQDGTVDGGVNDY